MSMRCVRKSAAFSVNIAVPARVGAPRSGALRREIRPSTPSEDGPFALIMRALVPNPWRRGKPAKSRLDLRRKVNSIERRRLNAFGTR